VNRSLVLFIAKRYLRFDKDQPFITLAAVLAFVGIALGVMVLLIAMALMTGFDNEFKKKLTVMNYPLTIVPRFYGAVNEALLQDLQRDFPELKFSPYLSTPAIAKADAQLEGGYLFGVDFSLEKEVNSVLKAAVLDKNLSTFDVVIGKRLKEEFDIHEGSKLLYLFTQLQPLGFANTPKIKRFTVASTFDSGLIAYDKAYSYTSIKAVRKILQRQMEDYDGIHIFSAHAQEDYQRLEAYLPMSVGVKGWWEDNTNFFAALQMEKFSLFIVLMLIILIAAINIISSQLMSVMNRRSDIALLLSLGASKKEIKYMFLLLGSVIGIGGIVVGIALGLGGIWVLSTFEIVTLPADVYPTSTLPLDLQLQDFLSIVFGAFVIVILSSYYPAKKASEVDILKVLRNE